MRPPRTRVTQGCAVGPSSTTQTVGAQTYRQALLSTKDIMSALEPFYGHINKKSEVVDPMQIIDFHTWFATCKWKMNSACISEAQQVSVVCQKLQGPILSAYMLASQSQTQHPATLDKSCNMLSLHCLLRAASSLPTKRLTCNSVPNPW